MSKHTAGPWDVGTNGDIIANGETIARTVEWYGEEENAANARLLAAAPELLFALRALLRRAKDELADPIDVHEVWIAQSTIDALDNPEA